jgi:hypothetical protein
MGPSPAKLGDITGRLYWVAHQGLSHEQQEATAQEAAGVLVKIRPHTSEMVEAFVAGWINGYSTMERNSKQGSD